MIDQASRYMFFGSPMAIERIQGINDNMVKPHYHDFFELYYLESGIRYHMAGDNLYCLQPGDFVLFPPYAMHYSYGEQDVAFKRLVLYFNKEIVRPAKVQDTLGSKPRVFKSGEKKEIHQLLRQILKEQENDDIYSKEMMLLLLNQLLLLLVRNLEETQKAKPESRSRMSGVIRYLNENYTEPITLEDLAARFYINPSYLCREFKKHIGSTVIQYVNDLRILHAQRLLQETDKSVTEISKIVGFSNVTHFNRIYKCNTGMSPSETRRQDAKRKEAMKKQHLE